MGDDPCKEVRTIYDTCIQKFLDEEYFQKPVKGPFVPCKPELEVYHECLRKDPKRKEYIERLQELKDEVNKDRN
jgi:hypothetical protein